MLSYYEFGLRLVAQPFSTFESEMLVNDREFNEVASTSNIYFIAQRQELFFWDIFLIQYHSEGYDIIAVSEGCSVSRTAPNKEHIDGPVDFSKCALRFQLKCGAEKSPELEIRCVNMFNDDLFNKYEFEVGVKLIRIWGIKSEGERTLVYWNTPDSFLWQFSQEKVEVYSETQIDFDLTKFWDFKLLYIGISKYANSYQRLLKKGHEKRQQILSREYPQSDGARVSDEITLFLFKLEETQINTNLNPDEVYNALMGLDNQNKIPYADKIADAEKAFVRTMQTKYNLETYKSYPKSDDGLYNHDIESYSFTINEDICFHTEDIVITGSADGLGDRIIVGEISEKGKSKRGGE